MKVTFWGTRGSIAAPGKDTVKYGGNTTCLEVRLSDDSLIVIDAGTGIRKLGMKLVEKEEKKINIFLTHPHWDHIQGFPFFMPMYREGYQILVHGWPTTNRKVRNTITVQMEGTYYPVDFSSLSADIDFVEIEDLHLDYNSAKLSFLRCNHPVICHSIKFFEKGKTFVFMTDNELDDEKGETTWADFVSFCKGADLLVHDAQYTTDELALKKGWGHSSYLRVLQLARDSGVKQIGLFHHDPEHSDEFIDRMVTKCNEIIKSNGDSFTCFAACEGQEVEI